MTITLTLTELLLGLLILAGVGVLVSLMVLIIKAIPGIKHLTKIMENAATLTDESVVAVGEAKETIAAVKTTVDNVVSRASGSKATLSNVLELVNAAASLKGMVGRFKGEEEETKETTKKKK